MIGGYNVTLASATGGAAGVLATGPGYLGIAVMTTSQHVSSIGLVAGLTAHF